MPLLHRLHAGLPRPLGHPHEREVEVRYELRAPLRLEDVLIIIIIIIIITIMII